MTLVDRRQAAACLMVACLMFGPLDGARASDREPEVWTFVETPSDATVAAAPTWVHPSVYRTVLLNHDGLTSVLDGAPAESAVAVAASDRVITLPSPDGTFARYAFVEAPVMAPALAAKFPQIKTYLGRGLDDPTARVRFDLTPAGFHAQVLAIDGAVYIDPLWQGDDLHYACYYRRDRGRSPEGFDCLADRLPGGNDHAIATAGEQAQAVASTGEILRTYRLACACTGEYAQFHGGGVTNAMAAIVTAINRVTGIYEVDTAVRLELIANNDQIVFTNAQTDPYSNNDGFAMLGQNQSTITNVIGSANYDIGHVFSTGGGGVASLGVICRSSSKARGVTGLNFPRGDSFYVDYVAHEMGHQFGGNHSFNGINGNCCCGNRNGSTAYEPGSGSTIMAYAGICGGDNLQSNSDPYFHAISVFEITNYTQNGFGASCAATSATGNTPPTIDAGPDYTIPRLTPFALTASSSDAEGDTVTYAWEQFDIGPGVSLSSPDNGSSPLFRSFDPTTDETRTFPSLSLILNNSSSNAEKLPSVARPLDFRVTVRDNHAGGGGVASDDARVVVDSSGPFVVARPTSGESWLGSGEVTWDVAGTDVAPVDAPFVDIYLSTDGGVTFPFVLASATPNDGSEFVEAPAGVASATARIKVQGTDNIFFDINNGNFAVEGCTPNDPPRAEPDGVVKNRYLSFVPPQDGSDAAIRVRLVDLPPPYDVFNNEVRWAGPPEVFDDAMGGSFVASRLQCTPHVADWSAVALLSVYGNSLVPSATYGINADGCGSSTTAGGVTELLVRTATWGDIVEPFDGPGVVQPDFGDVASVVSAFLAETDGPGKSRGQLQPDTPDPALAVDFKDIADAVSGFLQESYPYDGPVACP